MIGSVPDGASSLVTPWPPLVGQGLARKEDRRLVTGSARFIGDLGLPRMQHLAFVRSPHAHARITAIRTAEAERLPGVVAVYTGEMLSRLARPIRTPYAGTTYRESDWPCLALDKVRFVGEAVAAVLAGDRYVAEDGADLIEVDYEPLAAVVDPARALTRDSPLVHDELPGNRFVDESREFGSVTMARERAAYVVEGTFETQRSAAVPIECRGSLADYDAGTERLTLWTSTQLPHVVRFGLAECLQLPEQAIRVLSPNVGGAFGNKASLDPEQVVVAAIARDTGRPIRWLEDRRENFLASTHGHEERIWLRLSSDGEGNFLSLEADILLNGGAYSIFPDTPCNEALNCASCIVGPYRFENYRYHTCAAVTTTCPHGPYRGVARPAANFALETLVDRLARRLELDPAEVRRRNLLRQEDFPYRTVTGLERDSGDYVGTLELALDRIDYARLRAESEDLRRQGRLVGLGLACFAEECSVGTGRRMIRKLHSIAGYDGASLRLDVHGHLTIVSSAAASGQGHETTLAQLAADELGLSMDQITVRQNDSDAPYGMGSTGSRTAVSSGGAVVVAARELRARMLLLAAHLLEAPVDDLEVRPGAIYRRSQPRAAVSIEHLAWVAHRREGSLPAGFQPGLEATGFYDPPGAGVASNAAHVVLVEIDPRTGALQILRYAVAADAGRLINPAIVDGQVKGGVAQGIGKALYEQVSYADDGQLLNASLIDFLVPTASEVCPVEVVHMETPSPITINGAKGCGEGGLIGTPAAVGNAIVDALGGRIDVSTIPFTPERLLALVRLAARNH
jgi:carbon-monoxide dehydrogenase large subunit